MNTPKKSSPSGPAIFMYCVIAVTAITAAVCFILFYGNHTDSGFIQWTGITSFTIMYHLWLRIIMGNVTKLFKIYYTQRWFRELPFEKKLYELLRVKKWKDKALTYNPELFSLKDNSLQSIANTMSKAETDHWVNELISLSTLFFAIIFDGGCVAFLITAIAAMLFDGQFIAIQRFNRPRVVRLIEREKAVRA